MVKIEDMLEVGMVKDVSDPRGYSEGYYHNRVPVHGFYLKAKKGSLLERLEIYAKSKFKLERDPENYTQDVRIEMWLALQKYYSEVGSANDGESKVNAWVYTVVKNKMDDLSKLAKSNVSYYDYEKEEYIINNIIYLDKRNEDDCEEYLNVIMEIEEIKKSIAEDSKSEFKIWLENNKDEILTKKQIGYLSGDVIINDKGNESRIKKNIIKRVDRYFHDNYILENRIKKEECKLNKIRKITECFEKKDISSELIKMSNEEDFYVIDILYDNMELCDCKLLTSLISNNIELDDSFFNKILNILLQEEDKVNRIIKKYNSKSYI